MTDAYILDHVRTPRGRGKPDGALHGITPIQLLTQVLQALRDRNGLDTSLVEDVIMGCVAPVGEQGANIARVAALNAGYDQGVPGKQINRFCASGLEAVNTAAALVMSGQADLVVAGGVESMSRIPMGSDGGAMATDPQVAWNTYFVPQGISADLIATIYGISREDCDAYAAESQRRAAAAWQRRPVQALGHAGARPARPGRAGLRRAHAARHHGREPRRPARRLRDARPAGGLRLGRHPALSRSRGHQPRAHRRQLQRHRGRRRGRAGRQQGDGRAPRPRDPRAHPRLRLGGQRAHHHADRAGALRAARAGEGEDEARDIDLFELNEAFASVVLRFMQQLEVPHEQINVNGGAIALGHPLGATGAMVLGTLLDEMERRDLATGLVNLCVGAGMGTATILERA
jgi:acetyl-CoA C-acetyltransferase